MITSVLDDELYEVAGNEADIVRNAHKRVKNRGHQVYDWMGRYTEETLREMGIAESPLWFEVIRYIILIIAIIGLFYCFYEIVTILLNGS